VESVVKIHEACVDLRSSIRCVSSFVIHPPYLCAKVCKLTEKVFVEVTCFWYDDAVGSTALEGKRHVMQVQYSVVHWYAQRDSKVERNADRSNT